jgi:hypothetical protein
MLLSLRILTKVAGIYIIPINPSFQVRIKKILGYSACTAIIKGHITSALAERTKIGLSLAMLTKWLPARGSFRQRFIPCPSP